MARVLAGAVAAAALAGSLGACGAGEPTPETRADVAVPTPQTPSRVGDEGVTVDLPAGWHAAEPDDGAITDPVTRLVVASAPIAPERSACQIAAYAFAEDAVALVLVEWMDPTIDLPERPRRFTSRELELHPPPAIECFAGSGGTVQFSERGRTFGAYLLAGPRAAEDAVAEAMRVLNTLEVEPTAAAVLERNGFSLAVPPGWDGRVLFRDATGASQVQFQVANFELPANEGLEPPQPLPPGQEDPIKAMGEGDVLVMIPTDEPSGDPAPETLSLDHLEFLPAGTPRIPVGHALAQGAFCRVGRCFRIEIDFGGRSPTASLRRDVDGVLASLRVEAP